MKESIQQMAGKCKEVVERFERSDLFIAAIVVLVGIASFGLGRLSVGVAQPPPVKVVQTAPAQQAAVAASDEDKRQEALPEPQTGMLVGSRNSDKYHFPWCSSAQRINEENKVEFASVAEAKAAGYEPAGNCKGLPE